MLYYGTVELRSGTQVNHYTLDHPLGRGGQGTVWRAISPGGAEKALKLIDLSALPDSAAERARREARAVRELRDHPAIVPCELLFELPDDVVGLVFELVHGQPLSEAMRDPRMTRDHRSAVLEQIASALAHVHARDLVHRDLKPSNVLITDAFWGEPRAAGSVKLVDFGIVAPAINKRRITAEGRPVGTAPYLAPDVLDSSRWPPAAQGFTQDVFAFGVLGFELLRGEHPTKLSSMATRREFTDAYRAADEGRLQWPPLGLTGPLAPILARCLALDAAARPASGSELAALLGAEPAPSLARPRAKPRRMSATTDPHAPPTDLHAVPRSAVGAYTTSGPAPMPSVRVPPPPAAASAGQVPTHGARNAVFILLAVSLLLSVAFVAWTMGRSSLPSPEDATSKLLAPSPSPVPGPTADTRTVSSPKPCCGDNGTCKSGLSCGPGACNEGIPDRFWRLRITGIAARKDSDWGHEDSFSDDYSSSHPDASVCIRRAGTRDREVCAPLRDAATAQGDWTHRARLFTSDLEQGGVEIRIEQKGRTLFQGLSGIPRGNTFLMTSLCIGLNLYIGPKGTSPIRVGGYLDPD